MARGFFLSDALFNESWTGVTIVNGTGAYNNAVSNAEQTLAASPFALWASAEVAPGDRSFDIQFARGRSTVLADSACVFGLQVLGRLRTVSEVDVRSSLAAPKPTMTLGTKIPTTAAQDMPLEAWGYEQPPAAIGERPKVVITWRGNMYLPIATAPSGGRIGNGFRLAFSGNIGGAHTLRIARIVLGQKTTFGQNPRPNWRLTRTSPTTFDRIPGQYSGGLVRTPSYRTIQAEIGNIDNGNMKRLNDLYHLHGSGQYAVPLVLCIDPDNLDTLVYGRFIEWSDTFNIKTGTTGDKHTLRFTFEEVNS